MNESVLEFLQYDKLTATDQAFSEHTTINPYAVLESIDPEFADMVYTHEVFSILQESEQVNSVEELKEKINNLIQKSTTPAIYSKMIKVFVSAAVIGLGVAGGYAVAKLGYESPGGIAKYVGKIAGGDQAAIDNRTRMIGGIIGGLVGIAVGAWVIGDIVRHIGYWILYICNLMCNSDYTPSGKIAAINDALASINKAKAKFKDEKNQHDLEKAEEKLLAERRRLEEHTF